MNSQPDEKQPWRIHEHSLSPINDPAWPSAWLSMHSRVMWRRPPDTDMQALMEARPGESLEDSRADRRELLEAILEALETLSAREQYIFAAHTYERLSIRKIAVQFGCSKSAMHRELVGIRNRLQQALDSHPSVRLHLVKSAERTENHDNAHNHPDD